MRHILPDEAKDPFLPAPSSNQQLPPRLAGGFGVKTKAGRQLWCHYYSNVYDDTIIIIIIIINIHTMTHILPDEAKDPF